MRLIAIFLFVFLSSNLFGQYINGPANIRDKPNGEILYSINDYVKVYIQDDSISNDWRKIILTCKVKPNDLINKTTLKASSILYSINGDSVGYALKEFKVYENQNQNDRNYSELKMISVFLKGFTFKSNLRNELTEAEILKNKPAYSDSFNSRYIQFQDENGAFVTKTVQCKYYNSSILVNGEYQTAIVKEIQNVKRSSDMEGQESTIDLEIVTNYFSDFPERKYFTIEADKVDIEKNIIKTVKYGCCGAVDECQLFRIESFKKLMDYDKVLYQVDIPNSNIEGFIGFQFSLYDKNKIDIGTLTFCSLDSIINKVKILTHDKNKYDNIVRIVPDMEFETLNAKDETSHKKTELRLWSKNKSKSWEDITDFNFQIHFLDGSTGKDFTQKIEFKNGYIAGNPHKEFEIIIE